MLHLTSNRLTPENALSELNLLLVPETPKVLSPNKTQDNFLVAFPVKDPKSELKDSSIQIKSVGNIGQIEPITDKDKTGLFALYKELQKTGFEIIASQGKEGDTKFHVTKDGNILSSQYEIIFSNTNSGTFSYEVLKDQKPFIPKSIFSEAHTDSTEIRNGALLILLKSAKTSYESDKEYNKIVTSFKESNELDAKRRSAQGSIFDKLETSSPDLEELKERQLEAEKKIDESKQALADILNGRNVLNEKSDLTSYEFLKIEPCHEKIINFGIRGISNSGQIFAVVEGKGPATILPGLSEIFGSSIENLETKVPNLVLSYINDANILAGGFTLGDRAIINMARIEIMAKEKNVDIQALTENVTSNELSHAILDRFFGFDGLSKINWDYASKSFAFPKLIPSTSQEVGEFISDATGICNNSMDFDRLLSNLLMSKSQPAHDGYAYTNKFFESSLRLNGFDIDELYRKLDNTVSDAAFLKVSASNSNLIENKSASELSEVQISGIRRDFSKQARSFLEVIKSKRKEE